MLFLKLNKTRQYFYYQKLKNPLAKCISHSNITFCLVENVSYIYLLTLNKLTVTLKCLKIFKQLDKLAHLKVYEMLKHRLILPI